jgi:hypothetical protein
VIAYANEEAATARRPRIDASNGLPFMSARSVEFEFEKVMETWVTAIVIGTLPC